MKERFTGRAAAAHRGTGSVMAAEAAETAEAGETAETAETAET
ncbi:hypothetical protein [Streptomyces sp. NPDC001930]